MDRPVVDLTGEPISVRPPPDKSGRTMRGIESI